MRSRRLLFPLAALILTFATMPRIAGSESAAYAIETGIIAGAKFTLARPVHWNRRILLLAHAQRAVDRPLIADFSPADFSRKTLLEEGWIIATTSFRRNGLILADAIADLDALRTHIVEKYGEPERVLLEGDAMGGLIVTLIAERDPTEPKLYDAAVAIGATLHLKEPDSTIGLTLQPKIPLLFLANQTEREAFRHYVMATASLDEPALQPVLFQISRDGQANVNQRERLFALRALNLWLDHGRGALPLPQSGKPHFDATVSPEPQPSQVALHADHRGFDARVIAISPETGDITVNAQPADFSAIGLGKMAHFQMTVHGKTERATYVRGFDPDRKRGDWIAFADAEGFFLFVCHRADAAATARVSVGDTITIRRYDAAGSK